MPDMLVKLYELPNYKNTIDKLCQDGVDIREALAPEKYIVIEWVKDKFGKGWASECEVAFSNKPVSCIIAVEDNNILGFACYDSTCRDFFGPTGVDKSHRGRGIGKALLLYSLSKMKDKGYAYAIIGGAGPVEFYQKFCGAVVIEGSEPGIYKGMLK